MKATFQTRPAIDSSTLSPLDSYASLFGRVIRSLFAQLSAGKTPSSLKASFLKKYGITARQFNACSVELKGKISSIQERNKQRTQELSSTLRFLRKRIPKIRDKEKRHQKKRRLFILQTRLNKLENSAETVSLCFGSKKLFRAQFALAENGFSSHDEWKQAWQQERNSEIFVLGSRDETGGNQSCVAMQNEDGSLTLRLRLPNALSSFGKYLYLPNIRFAYGHQEILRALQQKKAICYRLKKDRKGWRLFATIEREESHLVTNHANGAIGLDLNAGHMALVETDRFGNPLCKKTIPLITYGKDRNQTLALIGDLSAQIVSYAVKTQKPLVMERLDFQKKKCTLRECSSKYARMLSSFAYSTASTMISAKAGREGVDVVRVNPAFTSVVGRIKYAKRYGLSTHHGAALCIARRSYGFSEKPPRSLGEIPDGKGGHVALPLPERNRGKHVWSFWSGLNKKLRVALAERFRARKTRSKDPPKADSCDKTFSKVAGANPARESLAALLG